MNNADASALPDAADDQDYLYRRAEQELEFAQQAVHPAAVRAHYLLAGHYLDGVYGAAANDGED